ncbi:DUF2254 domain-containing protein [Marivirga salinae]|uniref:DUF2254 domain-containing protein n=1 Tax=Marivirga salinarum TaxID=3059078 RepID=A0AA51NBV6_9BACT|nr:DUF2254 domain-containing protein [Marivirga sp. BDSF4-3]WMN12278.1 DUF2254 domain-containing protein [Marivirga sp. BDSF4-3]
MKKWIGNLQKLYLRVISSIAFYPTLLSILFLVLSLIIIQVEYSEYLMGLKKSLSISLVHNSDNARLILGTIVGSIISLMVFSFSMVMVVLNRATATLSPRVLPGLISNRFHQMVLGVYLGTIIFSLLLIVNIDAPDREFEVPSLGILISMILSFICLGLFVYFIHSISEKIQVDNILNDLKQSTYKTIKESDIEKNDDEKKNSSAEQKPSFDNWYKQKASKSGFLKRISYQSLMDFCIKHEVKVKMEIKTGTYLVEHYPFALTDKELDDEQNEDLLACFTLYTEEHISDHFSFGFGQISEIAVKALSPGINDPGTAIRAIDLLAELFIQLMLIKQREFIKDKEENVCVYLMPITFEDILFQNFTPVRNYGQNDVQVMLQLLGSLEKMLEVDNEKKVYYKEIYDFTFSIINSCEGKFENKLDREQLNKMIYKINLKFPTQQQFKLLV